MASDSDVSARLLPAGRYWFTVNHDDQYGTWLGWLDAFKDHVHVENTSSREAEGDSPAWDFYIFTTDKDLIWERGDHPTKAGPEIKSVEDTITRPAPSPDLIDTIPSPGDIGKKVASGIGTMATIIAAGVAIGLFILIVRSKPVAK